MGLKNHFKKGGAAPKPTQPENPITKRTLANPMAIVGFSGKSVGFRDRIIKGKFIILGLVLIAAIMITAVVIRQIIQQKNIDTLGACSVKSSAPLMDKSVEALKSNTSGALKTVSDEIQKLPKYQDDPNCLYPVLSYYIFTTDPRNAKVTYEQMERTLHERQLDPRFVNYKTVEDLRLNVLFLEELASKSKDSIRTLSNPED